MRILRDKNDGDIYEWYRVFPHSIRDLRFQEHMDADNVPSYYFRIIDEDDFREEAINTEPYLCIKRWIIDEITNSLMMFRMEHPTLNGVRIVDLIGEITGIPTLIQGSDMNASKAYQEAEGIFKTLGNLPLGFDNFDYMPEFTYFNADWVAVSKKMIEMVNGVKIKIDLKLSRSTNSNNNPSGKQSLTLNHVDEDKTDALKDFTFVYGDELCVYKFDSGKRISIYTKDKKEGVKAINKLMNAVVETMKKRVKVADLEPSNPKKEPHSLSSIKASFDGFKILDGDEDEG